MFVQSDSISEIIAHFIGQFELSAEEGRLRLEHEKFRYEKEPAELGPLQPQHSGFQQRLELDPYAPEVSYRPGEAPLPEKVVQFKAEALELPASMAPPLPFADRDALPSPHYGPGGWEVEPAPYLGEAPGSVAVVAEQQTYLMDEDVVVLAEGDWAMTFDAVDMSRFEALMERASAPGQALQSLTLGDGADAVGAFVSAAHSAVQDMAEAPAIAGVVVVTGNEVAGTHVNGEAGVVVPDFNVPLPQHLQEDTEPSTVLVSAGEGQPAVFELTPDGSSASMEVKAGGNASINEAAIVNAGLTPTFLAVLGDYHDFNAIVQTNVYSDWDLVQGGGSVAAATDAPAGGSGNQTLAFNVATFSVETRDTAEAAAIANPDVFPSHWQVSIVEGDVTFLSWITQYSFKSDNDIHVLTATGTQTTITTGENVGLNGISFADLGLYYDVVIIGGSLYDANIICQTNILYDDDAIAMLGEQTGGAAVSTSGNLLWNEASIHNVGPEAWSDGIPASYGDMAHAIAAGDYRMPDTAKADEAFEGFAGLRVLYISGDVYDLQYVNQTNVMCDSDMVATLSGQVTEQASRTDWDVSTGENALVNSAIIVDYDTIGDAAYLGGSRYSDAVLIQAELVQSADEGGTHALDPLVNEAIAFLGEDNTPPPAEAEALIAPVMSDAAPLDVMQSVLA